MLTAMTMGWLKRFLLTTTIALISVTKLLVRNSSSPSGTESDESCTETHSPPSGTERDEQMHLEPKRHPSPSGTESDEWWYLCHQWHLEPKPLAAHSLLHHQMQDGNHLLLGGDEIALGLDHHFQLLYDTLVRPER